MQLFAPLESDLEESANSVPEQQVSLILHINYSWQIPLLEAEDV